MNSNHERESATGAALWSRAWLSASVVAAGLMVSLPFLNPVHTFPIPTFYEEALALALGLLAFACVGLGARGAIGIPVVSLWTAVLAGYLLLQARWMSLDYEEPGQIAGLYVSWAAAVMVVGANLRAALGAEKFSRLVAGAMLISALLGAGAGLAQALDVDPALGGVVARRAGQYVFGNLAQRNLHADHLVMGAACLAYLWAVGRVSAPTAVVSGALLAFGIDASGSRASILMLAWLVLCSLWILRQRTADAGARRFFAGALALALAVAALGAFAGPATDSFGSASARLVRMSAEISDPSVRLAIYEAALRIWMSAPVLGVGFGAFSWPHYITPTPWMGVVHMNTETNAHNIVLHFLAETGLAGTGILLAGLVPWFLRVFTRKISLPAVWALALVGAELVHSLVEYPLWHAEFLGVAAVLAGFADPRQVAVRSAVAARSLATGVLLLGGALLAFTARSYEQLRFWGLVVPQEMRSQAEVRRQELRAIEQAQRSLLRPYADLGLALSLRITRDDLEAKLALNGRVLRFWQVYPLVRNQIALLAMSGRDAEALQLLGHLARLQPEYLPELAGFLRDLSDSELSGSSPVRARVAALLHR